MPRKVAADKALMKISRATSSALEMGVDADQVRRLSESVLSLWEQLGQPGDPVAEVLAAWREAKEVDETTDRLVAALEHLASLRGE